MPGALCREQAEEGGLQEVLGGVKQLFLFPSSHSLPQARVARLEGHVGDPAPRVLTEG